MPAKDISLSFGPSWIERNMKVNSSKCSVCGTKLKHRDDRFVYAGVTMCKKHAQEAYEKEIGSCLCKC